MHEETTLLFEVLFSKKLTEEEKQEIIKQFTDYMTGEWTFYATNRSSSCVGLFVNER